MVDIFANAGLVLDKDEAVDDVLNMFADNEAKIRVRVYSMNYVLVDNTLTCLCLMERKFFLSKVLHKRC